MSLFFVSFASQREAGEFSKSGVKCNFCAENRLTGKCKMKIVKALIPSAALLFFVGCGSVDHDPPELKVNDLGTVSPFDTLKVSFDKNVESFDDRSEEHT